MPASERKTILLVDNDKHIRDNLERVFRKNYNMETTSIIGDALMRICRLREDISLIITGWDFDVKPGGGHEIIDAGKKVGVPNIIVCSHEVEVYGMPELMKEKGATHCIQKTDYINLLDTVHSLLKK